MTTQIFEQFMLYFERMMVSAEKEKVFLLVDNFFGYQVPNVGLRLRVTVSPQIAYSNSKQYL